MYTNMRDYKIDNGTISVNRNYIGKEYARDVVKRCILYLAQEDGSLTHEPTNDIIKIGSDVPQKRRA